TLAAAAARAAEATNPQTDQRGPADYKRHLAGELTKRALRRAVARARGLV
ncbi:MAG: FAD binding domain-containing protein, partial [Acidimicrobiia bacterium]